MDSIFNKPESIFVRMKPMDLFFRGILVDCSEVKDAPGKGVCQILKTEAGNIIEIEENKFLFSLFGEATVLLFCTNNFVHFLVSNLTIRFFLIFSEKRYSFQTKMEGTTWSQKHQGRRTDGQLRWRTSFI